MSAQRSHPAPLRACYAVAMWIGGKAHRISWQAKLTLILLRRPYQWQARQAWSYSAALYHLFLDEGFDPAEALECDRQYWED